MAEESAETLLLSIKTTKEKIEMEVPVDYTVKQVSGARYHRALCHFMREPRASVPCMARFWYAAYLGQLCAVPWPVCGSAVWKAQICDGVLFLIASCPSLPNYLLPCVSS